MREGFQKAAAALYRILPSVQIVHFLILREIAAQIPDDLRLRGKVLQ